MFGTLRTKQKSESKYIGTTDLSSYSVTKFTDKNLEMIYAIFKDDSTLRVRHLQSRISKTLKGFIVYIDGMADKDVITESVINQINSADISKATGKVLEQVRLCILSNSDVQETDKVNDFVNSILSGDTALFIDGEDKVLVLSTRGYKGRNITEPENEKVLRGPKEGFNEVLSDNITMLRRKMISNDFKIINRELGRRTNTKVAICYLDSLVNKDILTELYKRLDQVDIDGIIDTNYINELIKDSTLSPFKTIGVTERPDTATSKLLEGRIALLIDGSPNVLTLPYLFIENFQASDDYYLNYFYTSFNRFIRILAFFISTMTPAIYLSLVTYHRELIPSKLALSISQARSGVPLPTIVEMLALLLIFELIRETSLRTHSNVVQSISIVGALVIGQAAVEAKFVSSPVVIIVAITAITELINPKIKGASIFIRFGYLLACTFLGFFGLILSTIIVITHVFGIKSFGINYMSQTYSFRFQEFKDFFIRAPWHKMTTNPKFMSTNKVMNSGKRETK